MEQFETILWWIAWTSTGVFALRVLFMFFGAHVDVDSDIHSIADAHDLTDEFQVVSVLSVLVLLMMGSWCTLAAIRTFELDPAVAIVAGLCAGALTALVVSWLMYRMRKLEADGTLREFDPKGLRGMVYTDIPPVGGGEGQVRLEVKGRLRTFRAESTEGKIESFMPVDVVGMTGDHVLRVKPSK